MFEYQLVWAPYSSFPAGNHKHGCVTGLPTKGMSLLSSVMGAPILWSLLFFWVGSNAFRNWHNPKTSEGKGTMSRIILHVAEPVDLTLGISLLCP